MKNIDYKAKFEKAIKDIARIRKANEDNTELVEFIDFNYPELKESEDEKIRKEILYVCHQLDDNTTICGRNYDFQKWISWLEKQGKIVEYYEDKLDRCTSESFDKGYEAALKKQVEPIDKGEISDGYHTFNELYYYRMLYNAAFFNLLPKEWVHKSKRHHTGEECFGGGWFIVMAQLPTGQISNHYELKDWDLFKVPEKEIADEWDGHSPQEAADRLRKYLLEKQGEQKPTDKTEPKFKVKYAGNEYNVFEVKDISGVTYYGIEDEPNHIDYIKAESCEMISGYTIKENGLPNPTKPAVFSEQNTAWSEEDEEMINAVTDAIQFTQKAHTHDVNQVVYEREIDWLKSIKDRMVGE